MDGILNINKPYGRTSFSIVATVKKLSKERRVGHAGTLDPNATGILPICLGQGTRIVEFLIDATKTYQAQIELGVTTDTYDAAGKIIRKADYSGVTRQQLESALANFCGTIQQVPPMYSAVRHQGQKLYNLARAGINIERKSRPVRIYKIELLDWQPPFATVEVECGKGTYIRSLAHDLGEALGCGACLKSLVRTRCGIFKIENAISLPQLEEAFGGGYWQNLVYPIDSVLLHWKAMIVSEATEATIRKGGNFVLPASGTIKDTPTPLAKGEQCRAYSIDGHFLGVLHFDPEREEWQPEKVFR